jgi:hypothetical protein
VRRDGGEGGGPVVELLRVLGSVPHHVRQAHRVGPKQVVNLQRKR